MLGSVYIWRPLHSNRFDFSAKVALSQSHASSPHSCTSKVISQRTSTTSLPRTIRRSRQRDNFPSARSDPRAVYVKPSAVDSQSQGWSTRFHHHSSSCLLSGSGAVGATIWHALLPSRHLTSAERETIVHPPRRSSEAGLVSVGLGKALHSDLVTSGGNLIFKHGTLAVDGFVGTSDGLQGKFRGVNGRFAMAAGLREGSWNVAWDARPARWLHGRHSAWLLFGVCACFSSAAGAPVPFISTTISPALTDAERTQNTSLSEIDREDQELQASHGKQVYTNYTVTGIPGDGRCLFRAVAHGSSLRCGHGAPNESQQRELADDLRNKVADELVKRRSETEWFIEGDFDVYINRIRQPHVWGGEPELLMLSHLLKMPITVYMADRNTKGGLIAICEYGQEYGADNPVRVLYHGFGHYEALQIHSETTPPSKL